MKEMLKHTKISGIQTVRIHKEMKPKKTLKIWDDQIKQLIEAKKRSYKKWLASKKLQEWQREAL
jgi:hypothetical protein